MTIKRVRYRETQTLRAGDLQDEQAYRIGMRRRHHIAHHQWGIVNGLQLVQGQGNTVLVQPGMAVDGYGRDLIVPQALTIGAAVLEHYPGNWTQLTLDAYLCYHLEPPPDAPGCDPTRQSNLSSEQAWLRLECGDPDTPVNPCHPPDVPEADREFGPDDPPMTDPEQEWPVYLGRIEARLDDDGLEMGLVEAELRYARLIGAQIQAPWADPTPWMLVSNEETAGRRRFAITLPDEQGEAVDRLTLDRVGDTDLMGDLAVNARGFANLPSDGDLALLGRALNPPLDSRTTGSGLTLDPLASIPDTAAPWQLYRVKDTDKSLDQLRFEILDPGEDGDPGRHEWKVGAASVDGNSFKSLLTARADGSVIIDGGLIVKGQLTEGIIPLDMDDRRFRDELLSRYTNGLTLGGNEVDAFYKLDIEVTEWHGGPSHTTLIGAIITVANNNSGSDARDVQIGSIFLEVLSEEQRVIHLSKVDFAGSIDNPLPAGSGQQTVNAPFVPQFGGIYTFIARVNTVGGSRSVLEQSASRIITYHELDIEITEWFGDPPGTTLVGATITLENVTSGVSARDVPIIAIVLEVLDENQEIVAQINVNFAGAIDNPLPAGGAAQSVNQLYTPPSSGDYTFIVRVTSAVNAGRVFEQSARRPVTY